MGALFFGLIILLVDCILELSLTTARLPVFFKQKDSCSYPAWAYAIPASLFKIPLLVTESVTWTCLIMSLGTALRPRGEFQFQRPCLLMHCIPFLLKYAFSLFIFILFYPFITLHHLFSIINQCPNI
ncbi:hypothetical protein Pint_25906 [Pistacia integerrima]|uniref:Uncharacterized protein n=1 Tax=Pistacia integerrima TaxID=434235 RepID=A0ACC0YAM1_9ROSI|nr:hypothetical protein Pint_25906 [Pistacia integerrima]